MRSGRPPVFWKQQLKDWGIQVEELPGLETGVSAVIEGAHPGPMLVLREDPEHNGFQDITDFVRELKLGGLRLLSGRVDG